ncbi:hypothetical protein T02_6155 [Trichinella nativa]|uniref:Uncharacterized protein n=2 Tax=Trichinella TaxID=6333 RepID=A0A0V1KYG0_9BILA|nr:hypothetical protein T09_248 [Trichinella sp. T9]KRX73534.1 hypothetical protein T06_17029 [Trichinella sp. T6]KRY48300.1 hypothetical protein T03_3602 [Trichinella britovi]KRZ52329.1 hypothetical protein T02_6155 [Trichinella nativa]KRZ87837.1 hypothetical protein T08_10953 [Trichinella sp. T8]
MSSGFCFFHNYCITAAFLLAVSLLCIQSADASYFVFTSHRNEPRPAHVKSLGSLVENLAVICSAMKNGDFDEAQLVKEKLHLLGLEEICKTLEKRQLLTAMVRRGSPYYTISNSDDYPLFEEQ